MEWREIFQWLTQSPLSKHTVLVFIIKVIIYVFPVELSCAVVSRESDYDYMLQTAQYAELTPRSTRVQHHALTMSPSNEEDCKLNKVSRVSHDT